MGNRRILSVAVGCLLLAASLHAETRQATSGNKSPVINAGRDAIVNYGLKKEEYRQMLREELARASKESQAPGLSAGERRVLEQRAKAAEEKLANLQQSYKEELARRKAADKALAELKGQLPDARIEEAGKSLREGDSKAAEQIFDEVVDKEGKHVALAAYHSGQLAEGRLDYTKAMRQYKKAVTLEEDNPDYLLAAGYLARQIGDYAQAQEYLSRLVAIEQGKKIEDSCKSCAFNELAILHINMGRYAAAEALLKDDLAIKERELGKNHPKLASIFNNLAELYGKQGKYKEAEPLYKRSLEISEKSFGKDHPMMTIPLDNLSGLYELQGRYADAEPLYKRALEILEKSLGKDHPDVARTLNNLAELYKLQGRYADAEPLYKRALEIRENKLGKDHPDVARTLNNLAELYKLQGRYADAEPLYKRALEILEKSLGKDHPDVARTMNNLAGLYKSQSRYATAEPLYKRALEILEKSLGKDHPDVAIMLDNFSALYELQGRYADAEPLCKRALEILEKSLGKDHPDVAITLNNLA